VTVSTISKATSNKLREFTKITSALFRPGGRHSQRGLILITSGSVFVSCHKSTHNLKQERSEHIYRLDIPVKQVYVSEVKIGSSKILELTTQKLHVQVPKVTVAVTLRDRTPIGTISKWQKYRCDAM
jgi:hypothetical protein